MKQKNARSVYVLQDIDQKNYIIMKLKCAAF